ncbi:energy transducer TonB, partial [Psychromonas hadalis]
SSGHKTLDNAVLEFIKKEHFMPALKGIEKVTSEQLFSFKFELI